jgi:hypothetical protein
MDSLYTSITIITSVSESRVDDFRHSTAFSRIERKIAKSHFKIKITRNNAKEAAMKAASF